MSGLLRKKLGRFKHIVYRQPTKEFLRFFRWGPRAYFCSEAWAREMEAYALGKLPSIGKAPGSDSTPIYYLTGRRHWYQTAFCAWTFAQHSLRPVHPVVIDDGTLTPSVCARLQEIFPGIQIVVQQQSEQMVADFFPADRFPRIQMLRKRQILLRKLTDVHAGSSTWRLFFDSDMLFFERPTEIDDYLASPTGCLFQTDCAEAYGYSRALTERLCGHTLPHAANIGIFSLNGSEIDWEKVEWWLDQMLKTERTKYNVTQCLCAMLMAGKRWIQLDKERYKVLPTARETQHPKVPLQHYVADSKPFYFRWGWKNALGNHSQLSSCNFIQK